MRMSSMISGLNPSPEFPGLLNQSPFVFFLPPVMPVPLTNHALGNCDKTFVVTLKCVNKIPTTSELLPSLAHPHVRIGRIARVDHSVSWFPPPSALAPEVREAQAQVLLLISKMSTRKPTQIPPHTRALPQL